jgi:hypothetical protein
MFELFAAPYDTNDIWLLTKSNMICTQAKWKRLESVITLLHIWRIYWRIVKSFPLSIRYPLSLHSLHPLILIHSFSLTHSHSFSLIHSHLLSRIVVVFSGWITSATATTRIDWFLQNSWDYCHSLQSTWTRTRMFLFLLFLRRNRREIEFERECVCVCVCVCVTNYIY